MLTGIPDIISPELLKILHEMGHGDELVIGDGNFPAASNAKRLVRCDGHTVPPLLDAILTLFPLDTFVDSPVMLMAPTPGDTVDPNVKKTYAEIVAKSGDFKISEIERFAFYERARNAYAIVATSETALYANVIIKKGVVIR
ncbi:MAG: L-fucose mutarotase [Clostridiales bacterium]|jgi:L-fucose mutarotase|nr:L-fucose mutarotase [Clostridiales bacterium]